MIINYDPTKSEEECAREIYLQLDALDPGIKKNLQKLFTDSPFFTKTSRFKKISKFLYEDPSFHSHNIFDEIDILDSD
jgi:hypothetical protein